MNEQMETTGDFSLMLHLHVERANSDVNYSYIGFTDTLHLAGSEWAVATEDDFYELAERFSLLFVRTG